MRWTEKFFMRHKLLTLFASFLRWYAPFFIGSVVLEVLHARFQLENYGKLKFGLAAYFVLVVLGFGWRLYDGLYRTGDLWFDERDLR